MEAIIKLANQKWHEYQSLEDKEGDRKPHKTTRKGEKNGIALATHLNENINWNNTVRDIATAARSDTLDVNWDTIQAKISKGSKITYSIYFKVVHTNYYTSGTKHCKYNTALVAASSTLDVFSDTIATSSEELRYADKGSKLLELLRQCPQISGLLTAKDCLSTCTPEKSLIGIDKLAANSTTLQRIITDGIKKEQPKTFDTDEKVYQKYTDLDPSKTRRKRTHDIDRVKSCIKAAAQFNKDYLMSSTLAENSESHGTTAGNTDIDRGASHA